MKILGQSDAGPYIPKSIAFSDAIIRYVGPIEHYSDKDDLAQEIETQIKLVGYVLAELFEKGVLVRGSMTIGKFYADENNFFGPAFLRAYELEHSHAKYPKVIIDTDNIPEIVIASLSEVCRDDFFDPSNKYPYFIDFAKSTRWPTKTFQEAAEDLIASGSIKSDKCNWLVAYKNSRS